MPDHFSQGCSSPITCSKRAGLCHILAITCSPPAPTARCLFAVWPFSVPTPQSRCASFPFRLFRSLSRFLEVHVVVNRQISGRPLSFLLGPPSVPQQRAWLVKYLANGVPRVADLARCACAYGPVVGSAMRLQAISVRALRSDVHRFQRASHSRTHADSRNSS